MLAMREASGGVILPVRAQPKASRQELRGEHDGALKVAVTVPAEAGRANRALLAFLARVLAVPRSKLVIRRGEKDRRKEIWIPQLSSREVQERLRRWNEESL